PAQSRTTEERAWCSFRESVIFPGVRSGLNLRHGLSFFRVEVVQPAGGAGRVRVIKSTGFVRVIHSARRSLHLARECSSSHERGHGSRYKQSSHLSSSFFFMTAQKTIRRKKNQG